MAETLPSMAIAIIASAILSLVLYLVMWRAAYQTPTKPATAKPLTLRISNIPPNVTKEKFRDVLDNLTGNQLLPGWSFAQSGHSERFFVGTATFDIPPAPNELELAIKRALDANSAPLRVDFDFFGITSLADPLDAAVDIIAVTGLAGHAFGSWKSRSGPFMWLRDFLPESIPNARILTYGYDTKLPGSQSTVSILELSRKLLESVKTIRSQLEKNRPLIFIGHSLGGLVVKEALVQAAEGSLDDQTIFRSCYAVIFFGVPNRGLDISNLESMVKGQPNEDLVRTLGPSSSFLGHLHERFYNKFTLDDSQIICFFETKETATVQWSSKTRTWERTGPRVMMVPKASAIHAGKHEESHNHLPIHADHSGIVKFSNPSDSDYIIIEKRIKNLVDHAPGVIKKRTAEHEKRLSDIETNYLKALNAPDHAYMKDKVDHHVSGTLQWFLHDNLFHAWRRKDESSILWVRGSPGQGKTVLSKFLLDYLASQPYDPQHKARIIYFFFYDQDERFQTVESFLRSLIHQLLIATELSGHNKILDDDPSTKSEVNLWRILENIIYASGHCTIYCILDALDECKDEGSRERLVSGIKGLRRISEKERGIPTLKLFVTSRPILDISRELDQFPCINLRANPDDLKIFIDSKVKALKSFSADLQKSAADMLLGRAGWTFLWVSIILKKLQKMPFASLAMLRDTIEESPTNLDELYLSIINQVMESTQVEQKLLAWVVYGRRPLTLNELEAALATQLDSSSKVSTDEHRVSLTAEAVTSAAGVILEITDDNRVHLIHQSAKDFLLKNQCLSAAEFCNGLHPNIYLGKVCMVYLCFKDFETGPCDNWEKLAARRRQYPFLDYAARNWHIHVRSREEVDGISNILFRLTQPGSPILRSWGEAAGIRNLGEAVDTWGIAAKANIVWLVEFQSSETVIGEEEVMEAVKNGVRGYDMIERVIRRSNVRFTDAAVCAIATHFNEEIMKLLLEINGGIKVTHALLKATIANRNSGTYLMRLLLKSSDNIVLTADLVYAIKEDEKSGKDIMELFLQKDQIYIEDDAVTAMAQKSSAEMFALIPDGMEIQITEKLMKAARINYHRNEVMIWLLDRRGADIQITEGLVQIVAGSFNQEVMTLLLDKEGANFQITEEVIKAAIGNFESSKEVIELLLDRRAADVQFTEEVLKAAAGSSKGVMKLLLDQQGVDVQITEEVVKAAVQNYYGNEVVKLLLDQRGADVQITEVVVKAAVGNVKRGKEVTELLLDRRGGDIQITEEVLKAAIENFKDQPVLGLLLNRRGTEVQITEEILKAAAGGDHGKEMMELLLHRLGTDILITEEVAKAAAENYESGKEVMEMLLDRRGVDVQVTEEVIKAAAGAYRGKEMMELLLDRQGADVQITEEVMKAAAEGYRGKEVLELLLDRRGTEVQITEEILKAAIRGYNGKEIMEVLLDRRGADVQITEEVMKAAAGGYGGKEVLELLLNRRGTEVQITEEILKAAIRGYNGKEMMELLLDRLGTEIQITEEVAKAAAGSDYNKEVMELLLDRRGADVQITEGVLEAAATCGNEDVLQLNKVRLHLDISEEKWLPIAQLYNAAKFGNEDELRKLLAQGVNPGLKSPRNITPLWVAAIHGNFRCVKLLLDTKAVDINVRSRYGQSPIFVAAWKGYADIVELLLSRGADPSLQDEDGQTPLSIAIEYERETVVDVLNSWARSHPVPS